VGVPGVHRAAFDCASVPPVSDLIGLLANAEAARDRRDGVTLEELATRLAGAVLAITADKPAPARRPSARDERRITTAVRRIEAQANEGLGLNELGLNELAGVAAMSPYHFLRIFRQVTGMTPHQYVLHTRLHRAAARLRASTDPISAIAFKAGFNDLSTFNRRFRRLIGATPTVYRATA
jgi:AraC family transcriptional regulator